jgi:hypothetical protein
LTLLCLCQVLIGFSYSTPHILRIFNPTATEYIFFSPALGTCFKINQILGYKASLDKQKKIEIASYILSDHSVIKLVINNKRNYENYSNT